MERLAPVAQRIEYRSSEPMMGVRFPPGALKNLSGSVAEWLKAAVLKTAVPEMVPEVRILSLPPIFS